MEDILMQLPSYCDDCETWHLNFIWAYDDGSYSICDQDGDHEPLEASDLPSLDEHDRLWREYTQWVADTGKDPLGNFLVRHFIKVKERWRFKVLKRLTNPALIGAQRAGRSYTQAELPEHVRSFLNLDAHGLLGDFDSWKDLIAVLPDIKSGKWFTAQIEQNQPRKESVLTRELRSAARNALKP
jgi:hypothetical protein